MEVKMDWLEKYTVFGEMRLNDPRATSCQLVREIVPTPEEGAFWEQRGFGLVTINEVLFDRRYM